MPSLPDILLLLLSGGVLGFLGGLFGIGGGIIAIPCLVLGFGMAQSLAQGTVLVLMVPNLIAGGWRYFARHPIGWQAALGIALPATATTWLVAHLATQLSPILLRQLFGLFLLLLALYLIRLAQNRPQTSRHAPLPLRWLPLVGMAGGAVMGLLGIGGGLVAGPMLAGWLQQRQTTAQALSLALVIPSSIVALATYAGAGRVDWGVGLPLAAGGLASVGAGVALAHRLPERTLRTAFASMLLITGLWLVLGILFLP